MKPFIDFNTKSRKDFSKDIWKISTNANYGKQLQNVRNYEQIELLTSRNKMTKYTSKTNFKNFKIFSDNLVAVKMEKVLVTLNQPVSVGYTTLEHAKHILFYFHYDVMMKEYGDKLKLLMTDTDSVFYHISSPLGTLLRDPYEFMQSNVELFNTSNYPSHHTLYSKDRKRK